MVTEEDPYMHDEQVLPSHQLMDKLNRNKEKVELILKYQPSNKKSLTNKLTHFFRILRGQKCSQLITLFTIAFLWIALLVAICLLIVGSLLNIYICLVVGSILGISALGALLHICLHHRSLPLRHDNTAIAAAYWYPIRTDSMNLPIKLEFGDINELDDQMVKHQKLEIPKEETEGCIKETAESYSKDMHYDDLKKPTNDAINNKIETQLGSHVQMRPPNNLSLAQAMEIIGVPITKRQLSLSRLPNPPPHTLREALQRPLSETLNLSTKNPYLRDQTSPPLWSIACSFGDSRLNRMDGNNRKNIRSHCLDYHKDNVFDELRIIDLISSVNCRLHEEYHNHSRRKGHSHNERKPDRSWRHKFSEFPSGLI